MTGIDAHDLDASGKIIMSRDWVYCRRGFELVIEFIEINWVWVWVLCYEGQSVGQSVLE
jgi:hypothetical protein